MERAVCYHSSSEHMGAPLGTQRVLFHCDNQAVVNIIMEGQGPLSHRRLCQCHCRCSLPFPGQPFLTTSPVCSITTGHHSCMTSPVLEGLLYHYQSLGVATSTRRHIKSE